MVKSRVYVCTHFVKCCPLLRNALRPDSTDYAIGASKTMGSVGNITWNYITVWREKEGACSALTTDSSKSKCRTAKVRGAYFLF